MLVEVKIKGPLWEFKDDALGYECGQFGTEKEAIVLVDKLHYDRLQQIFKKRQENKWDNWVVYTGDEGDGKSTMAKQDCAIMSNLCRGRFDVDSISWEPNKFSNDIDSSMPGDSLLYDETITGFNSKRSMSEVNSILLSKAVMCRKKRLFIGLCIPSLFSLQKEIAIRRSFGMVRVLVDRTKRGLFSYYNRSQKRLLYIKGKKYEDMNASRGGPVGSFKKWSVIDEIQYEKLKDEAQARMSNPKEIPITKALLRGDAALYILSRSVKITDIQAKFKELGYELPTQTAYDAIKRAEETIKSRKNYDFGLTGGGSNVFPRKREEEQNESKHIQNNI